MKNKVLSWQFIGFIFSSILGTLLHFFYEWTNENIFTAPFSGVNESVWEHMKILFWPLFLYAVVQKIFLVKHKNFWCIKLIGIISGLMLIPILFYTLNGAFGQTPDFVNIAIFYITAVQVFLLESWLFKRKLLSCNYSDYAFICICLIGLLFILFTFSTPQIPLFKDPLTGTYGL